MPATKPVFLFDVDNTLLDNDHVTADLKRHLAANVGQERSGRYWQLFEIIRTELGYADYLGALQRYRIEYPHDPNLLAVSYFLMRYPFANRLFPNSIDAVEHVAQWGQAVILSDGDVVFQPHKVYRSGLFELFRRQGADLCPQGARARRRRAALSGGALRAGGRQAANSRTPSRRSGRTRVTTVFVKQGHYALDPKILARVSAGGREHRPDRRAAGLQLEQSECGGGLGSSRRRRCNTADTIDLGFFLDARQVIAARENFRRRSCRCPRCRRAGLRTIRSSATTFAPPMGLPSPGAVVRMF